MSNKQFKYYAKAAVMVITVAFFLTVKDAFAQNSSFSSFKRLSCAEKRWVLFHPCVAGEAHKISLEALEISKSIKKDTLLDGDENGGQLDAFRHAYWMARLTQEIGWRRAASLGKAHEKGNYRMYRKGRLEEGTLPDEASGRMDFLNNDVGIETGKRFPEVLPEFLVESIIQMILEGKLYIISKDAQGNFLNCQGNIISKTEMQGKWENDKCIIPSVKTH
ncbi:MAG: hypothetical protein CVU05_04305 [Bacteroidetes bacterium HGW-Bacteroidetes-21]|nr:MAG: hypothetical protein CVU05_04305 [Bacteroidetes bacterium HGW-Bacteroidetes-21]